MSKRLLLGIAFVVVAATVVAVASGGSTAARQRVEIDGTKTSFTFIPRTAGALKPAAVEIDSTSQASLSNFPPTTARTQPRHSSPFVFIGYSTSGRR